MSDSTRRPRRRSSLIAALAALTSIAAIAAIATLAPSAAQAALVTKTVEYKAGDTVCEGYLAYDDATNDRRPGVLVVHAWKGLDAHSKRSCEELAGLGYVAFAADIYGKGVRPSTMEDAAKTSGIYRGDRPLLRARVNAGLDELKRQSQTDSARLAAIGYCFGGMTVLELARSGADLDGVVSFHGGLGSPTPADAKKIKAHVLALHGADDPFVSAEELAGFQKEMREGGVEWQLVSYGGAVHSFTDPDAGNDPSQGAAYDPLAARRAWAAMRSFFDEVVQK